MNHKKSKDDTLDFQMREFCLEILFTTNRISYTRNKLDFVQADTKLFIPMTSHWKQEKITSSAVRLNLACQAGRHSVEMGTYSNVVQVF